MARAETLKNHAIELDWSGARGTNWWDFVIRFLLGGMVTAAAGMIAMLYGPVVGGLFLAFPAIFPAGATLIEKHERLKKDKAGVEGRIRGSQAVSLDAAGAAIGCLGLAAFAVVIWRLINRDAPWEALAGGTFAWLFTSITGWLIRKRMKRGQA